MGHSGGACVSITSVLTVRDSLTRVQSFGALSVPFALLAHVAADGKVVSHRRAFTEIKVLAFLSAPLSARAWSGVAARC